MHIRPARPEDYSFTIAELIWSEHPTLAAFEYETVDSLHAFMAREWPTPGVGNSFDAAHVAVENGVIIGLMSGFPMRDAEARYTATDALHRPGLTVEENAEVDEMIDWYEKLLPQPDPDAFYVLDLSVTPSHQGQGIGKALLDIAKSQAQTTNCPTLCLDIYAENPALAFYKSQGLDVIAQNRIDYLEQTHGLGLQYHLSVAV